MKVSKLQAIAWMTGLLTIVVLFHLAVLFGIIPYTVVWGGKLETDQDMYLFEAVSLAVNLLLIGLLIRKRNLLRRGKDSPALNLILWFFVVLFTLNTIGNVLAETDLEKWMFTPLTALSAILLWIILRRESRKVEVPPPAGNKGNSESIQN